MWTGMRVWITWGLWSKGSYSFPGTVEQVFTGQIRENLEQVPPMGPAGGEEQPLGIPPRPISLIKKKNKQQQQQNTLISFKFTFLKGLFCRAGSLKDTEWEHWRLPAATRAREQRTKGQSPPPTEGQTLLWMSDPWDTGSLCALKPET